MLKFPSLWLKNLNRHVRLHNWRPEAMVAATCWAIWASNPILSLAAGVPGWLTVQAMAPITYGQQDSARHQAIALALQKAVDEVVADQVSADALLVQLKLSGQIAGAIPHARIADQQMLEEEQRPCRHGDARCYWVRLKAEVVEETAGMDPRFKIAAELNQRFFKDGEVMQITLSATDDCYVYIFNLLENGQVLRLLPNRFSEPNQMNANEPLIFPDSRDVAKGVRLVAHGLDDRPVTQEALYCLAVKEPLEHSALDKIQEGLFQLYGEHETFMRELIRQVVRIPLDKRAETMTTYQIVKP